MKNNYVYWSDAELNKVNPIQKMKMKHSESTIFNSHALDWLSRISQSHYTNRRIYPTNELIPWDLLETFGLRLWVNNYDKLMAKRDIEGLCKMREWGAGPCLLPDQMTPWFHFIQIKIGMFDILLQKLNLNE